MSRNSAVVAVAAAVSAGALVLGYFALQRSAPVPPPSPRAVMSPSAPPEPAFPAPPLQLVSAPTAATAAPSTLASPDPALRDEPTLMATLRELRSSDPGRTLALARAGDARFPGGRDAAERAWFVVKALTDLGRHDEARLEGRALLERYRDTRWAEDVYRHLFVNPGTHPFERGYGKERELDP